MDEAGEALALNFEPFSDRDVHVAVFADKFLVGRKAYECQICDGPIPKGERHRARTECDLDDHQVGTFRFCLLCCAAMAKDDPEDLDTRYRIGFEARGR